MIRYVSLMEKSALCFLNCDFIRFVLFEFPNCVVGTASIGIFGDELIAGRFTFHLLQSYIGTTRIVRSQALHEWRRFELEYNQFIAIRIPEYVSLKGIGEYVTMGFTYAIAKRHSNRRTVCFAQRLSVQKHVSVCRIT